MRWHTRFARRDPGDCLVCGAPHCSCGGTDPIAVVQLPARDAAAALALASPATAAPLGDGTDATRPFSTATYRGRYQRRPT